MLLPHWEATYLSCLGLRRKATTSEQICDFETWLAFSPWRSGLCPKSHTIGLGCPASIRSLLLVASRPWVDSQSSIHCMIATSPTAFACVPSKDSDDQGHPAPTTLDPLSASSDICCCLTRGDTCAHSSSRPTTAKVITTFSCFYASFCSDPPVFPHTMSRHPVLAVARPNRHTQKALIRD